MFLINSRLGLFSAACLCSICPTFHIDRHPFSRSYGVILPSSLTMVLPPHLRILFSPTCVGLRYGQPHHSIEAFLDSVESTTSVLIFPSYSHLRIMKNGICLASLPTCLNALFHQCDSLSFCVTPSLKRLKVVLEYQPVVHRLRLSASA